jgi:hypothetical protein
MRSTSVEGASRRIRRSASTAAQADYTVAAMEVPLAVDASWTVKKLRDEADREILYKVKWRQRSTVDTGDNDWVALCGSVALQRS